MEWHLLHYESTVNVDIQCVVYIKIYIVFYSHFSEFQNGGKYSEILLPHSEFEISSGICL